VVTAYILIQTEVGKAAKVTTEIVDITGVQQAQAVTGPYDVIVRAEARNLDELGQLVVARVQAVDGITQDPHLSDRAPGLGLWGTVGAQTGGIRGSTVHAPTPRGGAPDNGHRWDGRLAADHNRPTGAGA
jgi:hypothetical protein